MNAVTQTETRGINTAAAIPMEAADPTNSLTLVPLSRLMAAAASLCKPHENASAQARIRKPGRRRQGCGRLANASPVRDERTANLEQRGP